MYKLILVIFISIFLNGCSSIEDIPIIDKVTQPDYVSSTKSKKLELPPDFDDINSSDQYTIKGKPTSLKEFNNKDKNEVDLNLLNEKKEIKVVKSGAMRWLVIPARPKEVWPVVESFWEDMGFNVSSSKKSGIIETKWISESEINKDESALGIVDSWLDSLANSGGKRKFRTRIEDGVEEGTTEVYLSQRSLQKGLDEHNEILERSKQNSYSIDRAYKIEEYKPGTKSEDEPELKSNFKEDDLEIQFELLRRLMVKLGTSDLSARNSLNNAKEIINAELIKQDDYKFIKLNDNYGRAWRRLSLAIDMVGFLVEDKNRSEGIFYIKYSNLEIEDDGKKPRKKKGIFDKLAFWQEDDIIEEEDPEGQDMYRKEMEEEGVDEVSEKSDKKWSEKTWEEKFPFLANWGDDGEENVPEGEKRFRVRIVEIDDGAKVYIDYPNESINKTKTAQSIINILYDYLKT